MKRLLLVLTLISFGSFAQNTYSLQQCIEIAVKNNPSVLQGDANMQESGVRHQQARLNRYPRVSGNIGHGINQGRSIDPFSNSYVDNRISYGNYGINSGVVLFNGGALRNLESQTKLDFQASQMDFRQAKDQLTISVILAYLQVLTSEEVLKQSKEQAEVSRQQVQRLQIIDKDGGIPPYQLTDMKGQWAGEKVSVVQAEAALENAKAVLCNLMGLPFDMSVRVKEIDTEISQKLMSPASEVLEDALSDFAQIKAAELRVLSAGKAIDVAKGQLLPTLRFDLGLNTTFSSAAKLNTLLNTSTVASTDFVTMNGGNYPVNRLVNSYSSEMIPYSEQLRGNFGSSFGLSLSIPIFGGLERRNTVKTAQIRLKSAEAESQNNKLQLERAINEAHIALKSAVERLDFLAEQVEAMDASFNAAQIRFNEGVINSVEYITIKNNLNRAHISLVTARYDAVLRAKVLDFYRGGEVWY